MAYKCQLREFWHMNSNLNCLTIRGPLMEGMPPFNSHSSRDAVSEPIQSVLMILDQMSSYISTSESSEFVGVMPVTFARPVPNLPIGCLTFDVNRLVF